jgi:IS30 family transposase
MRKIITYDHGSEHVEHILVTTARDIQPCLCKPYHSEEKGSVEHASGLIRRFLPQKTDLATIALGHRKQIEAFLKGRPRKGLDD